MFNFLRKKEKKLEFKNGFVILIAIVISSLLISIGVFMANVAYKELLLSMSAKSTQTAFFAADTAIECALYQDLRVDEFRINNLDNDYPTKIPCNDDGSGTHVLSIIDSMSNSNANEAYSYFEGSLSDDLNNQDKKPYVMVMIHKFDINGPNDHTVIKA